MHHLELWTANLESSAASFDWLLPQLGWQAEHDPEWPQARTWVHTSGAYIVLERSPAITGRHDRLRARLNHLALRARDRAQLDHLCSACSHHGWAEIFADQYPHAGGPAHTALFIENSEGFEIEIVADQAATNLQARM